MGFTQNLDERLRTHQEGKAAVYTAKRLPVSLIYSETLASEGEAIKRERQLKGWTHAKKEALIERDVGRLKRLSKKRS